MSLADFLRNAKIKSPKPRSEPLWKGPEVDGITFSLLNRFLQCRERFRLYVVEGLRPADTFNHRIEYGNMWHVCEEALASERSHFGEVVGTTLWEDNLREYAQELCQRYPLEQSQIDHWYNVCKTQLPLYVKYWSKHPDVKERTPLLQEQVFDVPYKLPSGRTVRLRGKWDAVDLIGKGKGAGVFLQENKTKGQIDEGQIKRQLTFDLQTMLYLVALQNIDEDVRWFEMPAGSAMLARDKPLLGVRYNVVRRPLSGGKGSIVQHKGKPARKLKSGKTSPAKPAETKESYYGRLKTIIAESPAEYFMRWQVLVSPADIQRFRRECLDPILEQLVDLIALCPVTVANGR